MKSFKQTLCASAVSLLLASSAYATTHVALDKVSVGDSPQTVSISGFTNPVVIAGVPSIDDDDPGAVSISNVTSSGFNISFKEWSYLDGSHGNETIPYLVLEKGRHVMQDGSIWEVGTVNRNSGTGQVYFSSPFAGTPVVLLSGQTQNEADTYSVRAQSVTRHSFNLRLFEQEAGDSHASETIGYLAVYNPKTTGLADNGKVYSLATEVSQLDRFSTTFGTILLDEEQSQDTETRHVNETLAILEFDGLPFAADNSLYGGDAMTLRYDATLVTLPGDKTGPNGNIALIGTNMLSDASYSASYTVNYNNPRGAFDGYLYSGTKVNPDGVSKLDAGNWVTYGSNQWLQVDFGRLAMVNGFSIQLAPTYEIRSPKEVVLQISTDGVNFTDHETLTLAKGGDNVVLSSPALAQYFRLKVLSNYGATYVQIGELEYYGDFVEVVGTLPTQPPTAEVSCKSILDQNPGSISGLYLLDPDQGGANAPFYAYCDMETDGGGWTRVGNFNGASDLGDFTETPNQITDPTAIGWHVAFSSVKGREIRLSGIISDLPIVDQTISHNIINTPETTVVGTGQLPGNRIHFNTHVISNCDGTVNTQMPGGVGMYTSDFVRMGAYIEGQRLSGSWCYDYFMYGDAWGRDDLYDNPNYGPGNYGLYKNWQEGIWVR